ncbi:RDD family protein [Nocardia inohanensis]|uniref:RDD family protein n=1 Tax=Nocardia inohanensis TaxID=209246 RepID=UPI000834B096|nr:RDD family protein [Nocardia inohanensis]
MADSRNSFGAAPFGRQVAGWAIDFAILLGVAAILTWVTHYRIADYLTSVPDLAQTGAWDVLGAHGDWGGAGKAFGRDVVDQVLSDVIEAFAALILIAGAYRFVSLAWKDRTAGQMLLDLRVGPRFEPERALDIRRSMVRATVSTVIDVGLYSVACIALLEGEFALSFVLWLAAVVVLLVNAVLLARGRSLSDRIAGTVVLPAGLYERSWAAAKDNAVVQRGIDRAQTGYVQAQQVTQAMRSTAAQLGDPAALQQLRESEQARQLLDRAQDAGRRGVAAARQAAASDASKQAQQAARKLGASALNAYNKRRPGGDEFENR